MDKGHFSGVLTDKFVELCESRSDDWALYVKGRIEYYLQDLDTLDGFIIICVVDIFGTSSFSVAKRRKYGRPKDEDKYEVFQKMCAYLELNSEEQLTDPYLSLIKKWYLCNPDSEPYDNYHLKKRLKTL